MALYECVNCTLKTTGEVMSCPQCGGVMEQRPDEPWEDIAYILTDKGKKELKAGSILGFEYEGSPVHLRVMRKTKDKIWAKRVYLYRPDEISVVESKH